MAMPSIPQFDLLPAHEQLRPEIEGAIRAALASGHYVGGPAVASFEAAWAAYCGAAQAVGVGNGTDALEIGLAALGIGAGDEVILPAMSYAATAEAVVNVGARPVFADVLEADATLDPAAAAAAITPNTAAIIAVHLYGQPADLASLDRLASAQGLALIEDAAQAHGAALAERPVGGIGRFAAFSFYPSKNLGAIGDAGAIVSSDPALIERARALRNHGQSAPNQHTLVGRNSRLDTLQAAVLSVKLAQLDRWNAARVALATAYDRALAGLPGLRLPSGRPGSRHVYHQYALRVAAGGAFGDRDALAACLDRAGIETRVHYPAALHQLPAFAEPARPTDAPVAEAWAREELSLPMYPELPPAQLTRVTETLRELARAGGVVRA
ncbi:MAG: DegT/DnrJ/EryC1/StrS family aminotransferase [Caldilineae bacterium]|nr:DegT/DnrJ/EryC1/StrS family aminotransferase [Caldilineae bacterium]